VWPRGRQKALARRPRLRLGVRAYFGVDQLTS
jgi:hypothetical protein